jgi:hypothetical protein
MDKVQFFNLSADKVQFLRSEDRNMSPTDKVQSFKKIKKKGFNPILGYLDMTRFRKDEILSKSDKVQFFKVVGSKPVVSG